MALNLVTVTGTLLDASQNPLNGQVTFTPSTGLADAAGNPVITSVTDATDQIVIPMTGITESLNRGKFSVTLAATDNAGLNPPGWLYQVTINVPGIPAYSFLCFIPHSPNPVDLSGLTPATSAANLQAYLLLSGGTVTGPVTLTGSPLLKVPGATTGYVLISDASGNITAGPAPGGPPSGSASGDLGGSYPGPTVTGTHLASPLPLAQGGTGAATQQGAVNALTGTQSAGKYLRSDGTNAALASIAAADLPGATGAVQGAVQLAGDLGGTSASPQVTGTHLSSALPIAQGGTGATSRIFAGLLTPTAPKTGAYAAAAGDFVPCDTTSGAFTVTLPNAPADLAVVAVKHVIQGGSNAVTVAAAGTDVFNKAAGPTSFTLPLVNQGASLQYKASTGIWYVITDDLPLSDLDARYLAAGSSAPPSGAAGGDLSGTYPNPSVSKIGGTAFSLPVSLANGGTGTSAGSANAAFNALSPLTALGDLLYGGTSGTGTRLAGDTSNTRKFLRTQSSGGAAQAPAWDTVQSGDLPGATGSAQGAVQLAGDLGGTAASPQVTGTHLAAALPIAQGGTGQATAAAAYNALSPMTTLGDIEYESGAGTAARLAGSTSATKNFLTQTGTGSVSAAPAWGTIASGDLPAATTSAQGAVQIDSAASDIKATSTAAAAGSSTKVPAADHVHVQDYLGIFGDASDGAVTFDGTTTVLGLVPSANTYTMTRDIFCTSVTINNGVTLVPAGWRIFCQGTLTNNGTISAAGNAGNANGNVGTGTGSGSVVGGRAGGAGATTAGSAGTSSNGAGLNTAGAGGLGTSGNTGGAGGTAGSSGTSWYKTPGPALSGVMSVLGTTTGLAGGPGGGGGGGDATNKGGGGGSGGGPVVILAWAVVNNGTITCQGGAGGTPTTGNTGGGGGGSGGLILVYTLSAWTAGTTNVTGGAAGGHAGTGSNGNAGGAGSVLNTIIQ